MNMASFKASPGLDPYQKKVFLNIPSSQNMKKRDHVLITKTSNMFDSQQYSELKMRDILAAANDATTPQNQNLIAESVAKLTKMKAEKTITSSGIHSIPLFD